MHTAAIEWAERVAARNAVEVAKARCDASLAAQGYLPLSYEPRPLRCDAASASMTTPDGEGAVATQTGKEVAA